MKGQKFLALVALVLIGISIVGTKTAKSPEKENIPKEPVATETPGRTLTVTAVGDCTFATDVNASRELGFVN